LVDSAISPGEAPLVSDGLNKILKNPRGVLLVCQSDQTLGALASILHQSNESALTAQNAKDAWDCIKSGAIGCVVQDLTQSSADALTLFRACRSCHSTSQIPFLFLIKKDYKIVKLELSGPEVVRDSWLVLPCSAQLFLTAVRSLMEQKNREAELLAPMSALQAANELNQTLQKKDDAEESLLDAKNAVFAGQLGQLDVTKILSMIEPLRLTGVLRVADGKRAGSVHFVDGAVRHAELNDIEGADALFLLFHLKGGAFRFDLSPPTPKRTIEGNTMALLLEGLRQMDEAKAMVKAFQEKRQGASAPAG
jgi:DNA-binding response OmpR family regulator